MYIPGTTCFAHSSCTSLFILIFIKSTVDCIAHFILFHCTFTPYFIFYCFFFFFFSYFFYLTLTYIYIYSLVLCLIFFFFFFYTVRWADLSWPTFHYWLYPVWLCMWQIIKNPWTPPWTKHIYLKQCAVFTIVSRLHSWDTFTSNVDSAVELHSRDTALIHSHKSTLFACALQRVHYYLAG